jgi:hypothetical protein
MIAALGWNPETGRLVAQFGEIFYEYDGVSSDIAARVIFADSIGKTFDALIKKGGVKYRQITAEQAFA